MVYTFKLYVSLSWLTDSVIGEGSCDPFIYERYLNAKDIKDIQFTMTSYHFCMSPMILKHWMVICVMQND